MCKWVRVVSGFDSLSIPSGPSLQGGPMALVIAGQGLLPNYLLSNVGNTLQYVCREERRNCNVVDKDGWRSSVC